MPFSKTFSKLAEFVFKRTLIAIPFLVFAFVIWGTKHDNGDINSGSMAALVFILPSIAYSIACYIVYFIADHLIKQTSWNNLKYVAHLILAIVLIWFSPKDVTFIVLSITIGTLLLINFSMAILNYLNIS